MGFKDVDIDFALRRLADRRIEEAMKEGKFDNLPGKGQPIELDLAPANEDARLLWWALKILKNNDVIPDEVRWRRIIETLKAELHVATTETRVKQLVVQINVLVHKLNTLGTNAMTRATVVTGVSLETEIERMRDRERNCHD